MATDWQRQQQAVDYFVRMGWSPAQAAGIVANLVAESGLRPDAEGDGGAAYGIAQWHPPRQVNFRAAIGKDIRGSSLEDQLAFVHAELRQWEKAAGDALAACTTPAEAGACVSKLYERPADREGEAAKRGRLAEAISRAYGGTSPEEAPPQPAVPETPPQPQITPQGGPMPILALLSLFGPVLGQLIPQIAPLMGERGQKNLAIAGTVLDTVVKAAGAGERADAGTVGTAIHNMQADPALQQKVTEAVVTHPQIMPALQIVEVGGGAAGAREADLRMAVADVPFWKNSAVFWISVLLLPLVYWFVGSMIVGGVELPAEAPWFVKTLLALFGGEWTGEARSGGFNLVIGLVLGGICGVYFGVSVTQAKQVQQQAATQEKP